MRRNVVRFNKHDLHRLIKESVIRVLREQEQQGGMPSMRGSAMGNGAGMQGSMPPMDYVDDYPEMGGDTVEFGDFCAQAFPDLKAAFDQLNNSENDGEVEMPEESMRQMGGAPQGGMPRQMVAESVRRAINRRLR